MSPLDHEFRLRSRKRSQITKIGSDHEKGLRSPKSAQITKKGSDQSIRIWRFRFSSPFSDSGPFSGSDSGFKIGAIPPPLQKNFLSGIL